MGLEILKKMNEIQLPNHVVTINRFFFQVWRARLDSFGYNELPAERASGWFETKPKSLWILIGWLTDSCCLYLDFGSGAGLFTKTLGEEGSSLMEEFWAAEVEDELGVGAAWVWLFSDFSALSDLEERLMRLRNPPLLFFFSPSCDSELFSERLRGHHKW